jgi:hypothetical protein
LSLYQAAARVASGKTMVKSLRRHKKAVRDDIPGEVKGALNPDQGMCF